MLRSVQLNRSLSQDLSCFPVRRYYSICARRPPLGGATTTRFPHRWRPRKGAASPPCRLRPRLKKPTASYFAHHNPQEHSASSCCWTCCPDEKNKPSWSWSWVVVTPVVRPKRTAFGATTIIEFLYQVRSRCVSFGEKIEDL